MIIENREGGSLIPTEATSTEQNALHNGLDVQIYSGGSAIDPTQIRALTASDTVTANQGGVWSTSVSNFPAIQAVSQSGNWNIVDVSGTISLPTGASTSALQNTGNTSLSSMDSKTPSLGQATMVNSSPIVIASDQSAIQVSQNGTWNINNIVGTVSLPTGAATSALQTTGNSSLSSIDGKLNSLGQKVSTGSVPVVIASDQSTLTISGTVTANAGTGTFTVDSAQLPSTLVSGRLDVSVGNTPSVAQSGTWDINNVSGTISLPTGASTSALQTTGNTTLSSIDTKTPPLGQAAVANSIPVVEGTSSTANHSDVAGSTVVVTLQAANSSRVGWSIYNDSNRTWYIRFGSGATTTNFDVVVLANSFFSLPIKYTGVITGIQSSSAGNARIAEFV